MFKVRKENDILVRFTFFLLPSFVVFAAASHLCLLDLPHFLSIFLQVYGDFRDVTPAGSEELFVYRRDLDGRTALVLLNFSQTNTSFVIPSLGRPLDGARLLIGNYDVAEDVVEGQEVELRPYEGRVYLLA